MNISNSEKNCFNLLCIHNAFLMKTFVILFMLLALTFNWSYAHTGNDSNKGQGDQENEVNKVDSEGRKQGLWVYLGKDQPEKGYPENGKIAEGPFVDDRKNGHWIIYHLDGKTPKTEGTYENNRPNGSYIKYHPNGKIKEVGTYSKRFYIDSLKRYNELGVLVYESNYDSIGKESGTVKYFYDNGNLEFVYEAKDGNPHGKATRYWPNGDIKEELIFGSEGNVLETTGEIEPVSKIVEVKNPKAKSAKLPPKPNSQPNFKPNGYNKIFNKDKELWMEGDFKSGLLYDGRLYVYDEDGLLFKVEIYKEGRYHSDGQL